MGRQGCPSDGLTVADVVLSVDVMPPPAGRITGISDQSSSGVILTQRSAHLAAPIITTVPIDGRF